MSVRLGCAEEYLVFVTDRSLNRKLVSLPWGSIDWSRVLDDVSEATVSVPDSLGGLRCCNVIGGLVPWKYGLRIERDSELVWCGPITQVVRDAGQDVDGRSTSVIAGDKMSWMKRRLLRSTLDYQGGVDPGVAFRALIQRATQIDNEFNLVCPPIFTGYTVFREYLANTFTYVMDHLQELADVAVDYAMVGPTLVAAGDIAFRTPGFGLITAEWFEEMPGYTVDGWEQANVVYTPMPDSGESGFREWGFFSSVDTDTGVLDWVDNSYGDSLLDRGYANRAARTIWDLRRNAPVVVSGGTFTRRAAVSVSQLIPGVVCRMDLGDDGCSSFLTQHVRLKRVDVTVETGEGGVMERVAPEFIPLGTEIIEGLS